MYIADSCRLNVNLNIRNVLYTNMETLKLRRLPNTPSQTQRSRKDEFGKKFIMMLVKPLSEEILQSD